MFRSPHAGKANVLLPDEIPKSFFSAAVGMGMGNAQIYVFNAGWEWIEGTGMFYNDLERAWNPKKTRRDGMGWDYCCTV